MAIEDYFQMKTKKIIMNRHKKRFPNSFRRSLNMVNKEINKKEPTSKRDNSKDIKDNQIDNNNNKKQDNSKLILNNLKNF